jgi:hypothetical protein
MSKLRAGRPAFRWTQAGRKQVDPASKDGLFVNATEAYHYSLVGDGVPHREVTMKRALRALSALALVGTLAGCYYYGPGPGYGYGPPPGPGYGYAPQPSYGYAPSYGYGPSYGLSLGFYGGGYGCCYGGGWHHHWHDWD